MKKSELKQLIKETILEFNDNLDFTNISPETKQALDNIAKQMKLWLSGKLDLTNVDPKTLDILKGQLQTVNDILDKTELKEENLPFKTVGGSIPVKISDLGNLKSVGGYYFPELDKILDIIIARHNLSEKELINYIKNYYVKQ